MSEEAMMIADSLTKVEASAIIAVSDAGERGWWIHSSTGNWVAIALLEEKYPKKLFVGFSREDDPPGERVTLTPLGRAVCSALSERALEEGEGR